MKIIIGDFNGRIGKEVVGLDGEGTVNDKEAKLIELSEQYPIKTSPAVDPRPL